MRLTKKILAVLLSCVALGATLLVGCEQTDARGIQSIEKTGSNGLTDTYTIYYTDGTVDTFEITNGANGSNGLNGENGEDGEDVTAYGLYEAYVEQYGEISYDDFLKAYLGFTTDDSSVINRCLQSNAKVYTEFTQTTWPSNSKTKTQYVGSSVIYAMEEDYTYFLTNYHVVYNPDAQTKLAEGIYCYLYGSEDYPVKENNAYDYGSYAIACEYVSGSVTYDLALLRAKTEDVKSVNPNACAVTLAEDYHVGENAIAIGNPDDAGISVTKGVVSVDNDFIQLNLDGTTREYRSIRIDTPLYSGNSGGGLFNKNGELIGINNAGNTQEQNINYAIPLPVVKGVVENALYHALDGDSTTNGVRKIIIGVNVIGENSKYVYDANSGYGQIKETVRVSSIVEGGIAEALGLAANDCLIAFWVDGKEYAVSRYFDISDALLYAREGSALSIVYERDGVRAETNAYSVKKSDLTTVE